MLLCGARARWGAADPTTIRFESTHSAHNWAHPARDWLCLTSAEGRKLCLTSTEGLLLHNYWILLSFEHFSKKGNQRCNIGYLLVYWYIYWSLQWSVQPHNPHARNKQIYHADILHFTFYMICKKINTEVVSRIVLWPGSNSGDSACGYNAYKLKLRVHAWEHWWVIPWIRGQRQLDRHVCLNILHSLWHSA